MKHLEEDWERLSELDKMYLAEYEREIQEEWQHWLEDQERKPARVKIINKKKHEKLISKRGESLKK